MKQPFALTISEVSPQRKRGPFPLLLLWMVLGLALCYTFGTAWFVLLYAKNTGPISVATALGWCVLPYLLPDGVKLTLAALLTGLRLWSLGGALPLFWADALETAATLASETGTGARGLRSILEKAMRDVMFSAPKSAAKSGPLEIVVTREMILGTAKPVLRLSV